MNWPAIFRNIFAERFISAVSILGLACAFAAAILIAIFVRGERNFDSHWQDAGSIYIVTSEMKLKDKPPMTMLMTVPDFATRLRAALGDELEIVRRIPQSVALRREDSELSIGASWADPRFFDVFPMTAVAGELRGALDAPGNLVLTATAARRLFGGEPAVGALLQLDRNVTVRVVAVVEDLPRDTHLSSEAFLAGGTQGSPLAPGESAVLSFSLDTYTYLKVSRSHSLARVNAAIEELTQGFYRAIGASAGFALQFTALPIREAHMMQPTVMVAGQGNPVLLDTLVVIAALIVLAAGVNFVNLMTAQASHRTVEIGVRKIHGARRSDLVLQFMGETVAHAAIALLIALAVVEISLPALRGFLSQDLPAGYISQWEFWLCVGLCALGLGAIAGIYPAFVLSSFRPAAAIKGHLGATVSSGNVRRALVVLQFGVLTVLFFSTLVVARQMHFAMNDGLRLDKRNVLLVFDGCRDAFVDEIRKLPGISAAACSESGPASSAFAMTQYSAPAGTGVAVAETAVQPGFFEVYGLAASAGRLPAASDIVDAGSASRRHLILNEAAVKRLGFPDAASAIGARLRGSSTLDSQSVEILGVVPDFPTGSIREEIGPQAYYYDPSRFRLLSVKLEEGTAGEVVAGIDALWRRVVDTGPMQRMFVEDFVDGQFRKELRQSMMFGIFAVIALLISCFGLYALAVSTSRRRTREIGIRKALGASNATIVRLLVWDFSKPVLVAVLCAAPIGYYVMSNWLSRFPSKIELGESMFLISALAAVLVAWLSVGLHAMSVARANPIHALRHS